MIYFSLEILHTTLKWNHDTQTCLKLYNNDKTVQSFHLSHDIMTFCSH